MKNFVVSDLHGQGQIYYSILDYLDKIDDEVKLIINGDIIDRGPDSIEILKDSIKRDNVELLAGNHELMMLDYLMTNSLHKKVHPWISRRNGGKETFDGFNNLSIDEREMLIDYLKQLKITLMLENKIFNYDGVVIGHAKPLKNIQKYDTRLERVLHNCLLEKVLWDREEDLLLFERIDVPGYLTIIGHTPNLNEKGYNFKRNVLNIDGGAARIKYLDDPKEVNVPLVELDFEHDKLIFTGFNFDGEITYNNSLEVQDGKRLIKKG